MDRFKVSSSAINAVGHDGNETAEIEFHPNKSSLQAAVWQYRPVAPVVVRRMLDPNCESVGKIFTADIKDNPNVTAMQVGAISEPTTATFGAHADAPMTYVRPYEPSAEAAAAAAANADSIASAVEDPQSTEAPTEESANESTPSVVALVSEQLAHIGERFIEPKLHDAESAVAHAFADTLKAFGEDLLAGGIVKAWDVKVTHNVDGEAPDSTVATITSTLPDDTAYIHNVTITNADKPNVESSPQVAAAP